MPWDIVLRKASYLPYPLSGSVGSEEVEVVVDDYEDIPLSKPLQQ